MTRIIFTNELHIIQLLPCRKEIFGKQIRPSFVNSRRHRPENESNVFFSPHYALTGYSSLLFFSFFFFLPLRNMYT